MSFDFEEGEIELSKKNLAEVDFKCLYALFILLCGGRYYVLTAIGGFFGFRFWAKATRGFFQ
jgi:hypothetical protein